MLTTRELSYGLYGAWRMARLDADAMRYFDASVDGFWKSFQVAWLVLPVALIETVLQYWIVGLPRHAGPVEIFVVEVSAYIMSWVAFPLLMSMVSDLLQRGERYTAFVVAFNWAKLPITIVDLIAFVIVAMAGVDPLREPSAVTTIAFFAICFYLWFVAKTALQINGWSAGAVVILFFIVDGLIQYTAVGLLS